MDVSAPALRSRLDGWHARAVALVAGAVAVCMALYHMWVIVTGTPEAIIFRGTHLLFAIVLTFLLVRRRGAEAGQPPSRLDYALLALASAPVVYLFWNYDYVVNRIYYIDDLSWADMALAVVLVVMVLEATRRLIGWALPLTALVFLAYGLLVARVEPMRLLDQLFMTTEGIFGAPLGVSAAYVMIFVLFGSFMERTGTGQLFMDFALSLTGHSAGGPGKVSVVSSSLFGTISGSAVANVMVDGPISIPLMKRTGFKPHFAAGVEAVASTGGQIMPPIMGAAAFVMAEFLAVSYLQVTIWALIPAILYYVACFGAVHFEAKRRGILGVPRSELPRLGTTLRERGHLFIPVLTILVIMYSGYSAPLAALAGTLACFPVALLRASTRGNVTFRNVVEAMIDGARNALAVALACACAGIVIGVVALTGAGIVFTQAVLGLAQNSLLLALLLTMMAGIVLGMGMPTTPAYIVMTALLVPALIKLGVIAAGGAYVRLLFRYPIGHHAARGARRLRGGGARQVRSLDNRLGRREDRRRRLHRALHVRLRTGPLDDRRLGHDRLALHRLVRRHPPARCRPARLSVAARDPVGTRRPDRRRLLACEARLGQRPRRLLAPHGGRRRPVRDAPPRAGDPPAGRRLIIFPPPSREGGLAEGEPGGGEMSNATRSALLARMTTIPDPITKWDVHTPFPSRKEERTVTASPTAGAWHWR